MEVPRSALGQGGRRLYEVQPSSNLPFRAFLEPLMPHLDTPFSWFTGGRVHMRSYQGAKASYCPNTITRRLSSPRALSKLKFCKSSTVKSMNSSKDTGVCVRESHRGGALLRCWCKAREGGQTPIREKPVPFTNTWDLITKCLICIIYEMHPRENSMGKYHLYH